MQIPSTDTFSYTAPAGADRLTISILVDTPGSWIHPWAALLCDILKPHHRVALCGVKEELLEGNFAFLLGCTRMLPPEFLGRNRLNLVVHESDLPRGRGWSPVAWQVLDGANSIPVVLFEATGKLDAGGIYLRDTLELDGTELLPEIRYKQGVVTLKMVLGFLKRWPDVQPQAQAGDATFYARRGAADDRLDEHKTIAEQFDHLRIVDNRHYPAWFIHKGKKYYIHIYPDNDETVER